jgi:hypothetical protein
MRYKIFLLLRWLGRMVYKVCSWLSNKVYQVPKSDKPVKMSSTPELFYEPKRKFRWTLNIDGLPPYVVCKAHRPCLGTSIKQLSVVVYDPIEPSSAKVFWQWSKERKLRNATLQLLDPVGTIIEEWKYVGLSLACVDLGELDYASPDPVKITLWADYKSVELVDARAKKGV